MFHFDLSVIEAKKNVQSKASEEMSKHDEFLEQFEPTDNADQQKDTMHENAVQPDRSHTKFGKNRRLRDKHEIQLATSYEIEKEASAKSGLEPRNVLVMAYKYSDELARIPRPTKTCPREFIFPRPTLLVEELFKLEYNKIFKFIQNNIDEFSKKETIACIFQLPASIRVKARIVKWLLLSGIVIDCDTTFPRHQYYTGYSSDMRELEANILNLLTCTANYVDICAQDELVKIIEYGFAQGRLYRFANIDRVATLIRPLLSLAPKYRQLLINFLGDYDHRRNPRYDKALKHEFKRALARGEVEKFEFLYNVIHREYFYQPEFSVNKLIEVIGDNANIPKASLIKLFQHALNPFGADANKPKYLNNFPFTNANYAVVLVALEVYFKCGYIFDAEMKEEIKSIRCRLMNKPEIESIDSLLEALDATAINLKSDEPSNASIIARLRGYSNPPGSTSIKQDNENNQSDLNNQRRLS